MDHIEQGIGIYELLLTGGLPLGGALAAWIHMKTAVATLEQKVIYLSKELTEEKESNKDKTSKTFTKIDSILTLLSQLQVDIATLKK